MSAERVQLLPPAPPPHGEQRTAGGDADRSLRPTTRYASPLSSIAEWSLFEQLFQHKLHFLKGEAPDVAALAAAHADKADRVLLMPYTHWQDYRVLLA